ncbi:lipoate--protein ligase family protein [Salinibacillus xinjiangensis]|uniref:Octanoyl-[GcvH]:protein N-octanoyltransferase n=1 Tax=Salinibacillus xinjiangensis TaxID=1229268 RepID=A0A6G1X5P5_9BACI|nr:lipoate--protein ligase family protein [Salinibacillus xinjiangensis]MRG86249.1 octanoyltransferase [Salinibacillus xinjiangensis]
MKDLHPILHFDQVRFLDQSNFIHIPAMQSFATDDALCLSVSEGISTPTARLWVHDRTIVLGIPDSRLPHLQEGIKFLQANGYQIVVRNSGGLAVVLDPGILNLSLIFPTGKKLGIHDGYEAMVSFVKELFMPEQVNIEAYEVVGSYCPGDYDLSINGKKFAGISQRRVKDGTAVQIYMCVDGSGSERAALVQQFYEKGLQGESSRFTYPDIQPDSMASLSELLGKPITVEDIRNRILYKLNEISNTIKTEPLNDQELVWFEKRLEQMVERNEKVFG